MNSNPENKDLFLNSFWFYKMRGRYLVVFVKNMSLEFFIKKKQNNNKNQPRMLPQLFLKPRPRARGTAVVSRPLACSQGSWFLAPFFTSGENETPVGFFWNTTPTFQMRPLMAKSIDNYHTVKWMMRKHMRKNKSQNIAYFGNLSPDFLNYLYWNVFKDYFHNKILLLNRSLVWQETLKKYFKVPLRLV